MVNHKLHKNPSKQTESIYNESDSVNGGIGPVNNGLLNHNKSASKEETFI